MLRIELLVVTATSKWQDSYHIPRHWPSNRPFHCISLQTDLMRRRRLTESHDTEQTCSYPDLNDILLIQPLSTINVSIRTGTIGFPNSTYRNDVLNR